MTAIEEKSKQNNDDGHAPSSVLDCSGENGSGTNSKSGAPLTQPRSAPVLYWLTGPNGEFGGLYRSAIAAAEAAKRSWPGLEQGEEGVGWDVRIAQ